MKQTLIPEQFAQRRKAVQGKLCDTLKKEYRLNDN